MSNSQNALEEINNEDILVQLEKILSNPDFLKKSQLGKFLNFIVTETLAGRETQVKQYTVAVKAFGRDSDFDPQADPIVRIEARRLRRALARYYREPGKEDPIRIGIPVGGYVPVFSKHIITEIKDPTVRPEIQSELQGGKDPLRLAVYPFTNLSPDEIDYCIVDGVCEEISSNLTRFQEFSVITYFSMKQIQKEGLTLGEVYQRFGITYLVTGSIRISGQHVRVVTSLVHLPAGEELWSQTYNREIRDITIFELLDEIAVRIVAVIGSGQGVVLRNVARASKHPLPKNLTVLEAISRYYESQWNFDHEAFLALPAALEEAAEIDPKNALVWAVLGEIYCDFYSHNDPLIEDPLTLAEKCAAKALNLDPLCQHAHHLRAYIALHKRETDTIIEACDRVIELNPNNAYLTGLAGFWTALAGEYERGIPVIRRAMEINPYFPPYFHHAFLLDHYRKGEYLGAYAEAERFNMPDYYWDPLDKAITLCALDRIPEAQHKLNELRRLTPNFETNPDEFLSAFVLDDQLKKDMLEQLSKAGVAIENHN
jgi:adenylate cyclase